MKEVFVFVSWMVSKISRWDCVGLGGIFSMLVGLVISNELVFDIGAYMIGVYVIGNIIMMIKMSYELDKKMFLDKLKGK